MAQVELLLPKMGESVTEATIIEWLVSEGATVEEDDFVVNIATDKVDNEVPAPCDGTLVKILVQKDEVVQVGSPIAIIETEASGVESAAPAAAAAATPAPTPIHESKDQEAAIAAVAEDISKTGPTGRFYSPLVRNIAKEEGIGMAELEAIKGTGNDGRVTKNDILGYLKTRGQNGAVTPPPAAAPKAAEPAKAKPAAAAPAPAKHNAPPVVAGPNDEIVEMDRMRKLIADHMVMSKHVSPHVTSFVEADVTNLVLWRNKVKGAFEKREGQKITFTPIFLEAVAKALKDFPMVNASVDGYNVVVRKDINIGMATALPSGNLIVPVIKNADSLNLMGLAKAVNDLSARARKNELKPEDIQGGTYTVSNVGTFGNVMGTPIINQPQVGILALGAIRKKPAVIETPYGDTLGIRHMMFLSHSYDHRSVDGALGGMFVKRVADYLEQWDIDREI